MNVLIKIACTICIALIFLLSCGSKELIDNTEEIVAESSGAAPSLASPAIKDASTNFVVLKGTVLGKGGSVVTNRGFCWSLEASPTIDDASIEASSVNGAGEFSAEIKDLTQNTTYYIRAWAKNKGGIGYSESFQFTTNKVQPVVFTETPLFIVGSMRAAYDVEIANSGGGEITERGICWSTNATPTIADNKYVDAGVGTGKFRAVIAGLTERTQYYLRAYAINEGGISYGISMPFKTIGKGKLTYTLNGKPENPTGELKAVWDRLQIAIDSAAWYIENYTSAQKHVWINYAPQTPTADANNEGWMRFGTGVGYQNLRTMLHELNHCFGTGTTGWWTGTALSNGKYQLPHANNMLKLINRDNDAVLSGDGWHWWPYGLNQNNEVTSSWDYVYNCLIIEAMRKDGLTHSGSYTP